MANGKTVLKSFRVTEKEAERISRAAVEAGMKESEYFRRCVSRGPMEHKEIRLLLHKILNEINSIGKNINQIVKNNNSGLYLQADKDVLLIYMKRLNASVQEVNNKINKMKYDYMEDFENEK